MRIDYLFIPLLTLTLLAGCATVTVQYDYDTTADFAALRTYDWMERPSGKGAISDLTAKRVISAVDGQLQARGYGLAAQDPDFLVAIHGSTRQKVDVVDYGYHYGRYDRYRSGYYGSRRIDTVEYEEGTLIIDFIDADSRDLIWRGSGTGVTDPGASPEKREKRINEAVAKILQKFPPPQ